MVNHLVILGSNAWKVSETVLKSTEHEIRYLKVLTLK